jgi:hypothetical protein
LLRDVPATIARMLLSFQMLPEQPAQELLDAAALADPFTP